MIDIYRYISDFKSTSDFENIYYFYEKHILFLCRRYNIEEYYNSLMIKLWELTIKVDLKKFNNSKLLDSYIRKSLKNFAINLYRGSVRKMRIYNVKSIFPADTKGLRTF